MTEKDMLRRVRWSDFGEVTYPPGGSLGPRVQSNYQFFYLRKGRCCIQLDEEVYRVEPGSVFLLIPGRIERYTFDDSSETEHAWLHFQWSGGPPRISAGLPVLPFVAAMTDRIEMLIRLGIDIPGHLEMLELESRNRIAECLWYEFIAQCPSDYTPKQPLHPAVQRAQSYIDTHWRQELKLESIARQAHLTPRHLTRLFQQHFGETPIHYLWSLRINRAIGLLQSSGLRISEIAEQTGFTSTSHFTRAIKEKTGMAPRELRGKCWQLKD